MANAPIQINVTANAQSVFDEIISQAKKAENAIKKVPLRIELKNFGGGLKAFSADLDRFDKSVSRMSAVITTFGQAAAVIFTVQNAFAKMVKTSIDVEKKLNDINAIFGASAVNFQKFSAGIFNIAKQTGQSFDTAATAAQEFARQGLSLEETLKRTQNALTLTRISGLEAGKAVEGLTAIFNTYRKELTDVSQITNTVANVDTKFAVSSSDLIEAIKRSGASASSAKVPFNELIAAVTALQQTTARGGSVIGNSLKTIFTRLQTNDTVQALKDIGVNVRDAEGNTRPLLTVLSELSQKFYSLSDAQKANIKQQVAGVYQVNQLSALLGDLSSQYSVYRNALDTANTTTNEAAVRMEILKKTTAGSINDITQSLTEFSAQVGKVAINPLINNILKPLNSFFETISKFSEGGFGKGIVEGIGTAFQTGLVPILTKASFNIVRLVGKGVSEQIVAATSLNRLSEDQLRLQEQIKSVYASTDPLIQARITAAATEAEKHQVVLNILREEVKAYQTLASLSSAGTNYAIKTRQTNLLSNKAGGFLPEIASSVLREQKAINSGVGGAPPNAKPVIIPNFNMGYGSETIVANSSEYLVKNYANSGGDAIFNQDMVGKYGLPSGAKKIMARGRIPNFAKPEDAAKKLFKALSASESGIVGSGPNKGKPVDFGNLTDPTSFVEDLSKSTKLFNSAMLELVPRLQRQIANLDEMIKVGNLDVESQKRVTTQREYLSKTLDKSLELSAKEFSLVRNPNILKALSSDVSGEQETAGRNIKSRKLRSERADDEEQSIIDARERRNKNVRTVNNDLARREAEAIAQQREHEARDRKARKLRSERSKQQEQKKSEERERRNENIRKVNADLTRRVAEEEVRAENERRSKIAQNQAALDEKDRKRIRRNNFLLGASIALPLVTEGIAGAIGKDSSSATGRRISALGQGLSTGVSTALAFGNPLLGAGVGAAVALPGLLRSKELFSGQFKSEDEFRKSRESIDKTQEIRNVLGDNLQKFFESTGANKGIASQQLAANLSSIGDIGLRTSLTKEIFSSKTIDDINKSISDIFNKKLDKDSAESSIKQFRELTAQAAENSSTLDYMNGKLTVTTKELEQLAVSASDSVSRQSLKSAIKIDKSFVESILDKTGTNIKDKLSAQDFKFLIESIQNSLSNKKNVSDFADRASAISSDIDKSRELSLERGNNLFNRTSNFKSLQTQSLLALAGERLKSPTLDENTSLKLNRAIEKSTITSKFEDEVNGIAREFSSKFFGGDKAVSEKVGFDVLSKLTKATLGNNTKEVINILNSIETKGEDQKKGIKELQQKLIEVGDKIAIELSTFTKKSSIEDKNKKQENDIKRFDVLSKTGDENFAKNFLKKQFAANVSDVNLTKVSENPFERNKLFDAKVATARTSIDEFKSLKERRELGGKYFTEKEKAEFVQKLLPDFKTLETSNSINQIQGILEASRGQLLTSFGEDNVKSLTKVLQGGNPEKIQKEIERFIPIARRGNQFTAANVLGGKAGQILSANGRSALNLLYEEGRNIGNSSSAQTLAEKAVGGLTSSAPEVKELTASQKEATQALGILSSVLTTLPQTLKQSIIEAEKANQRESELRTIDKELQDIELEKRNNISVGLNAKGAREKLDNIGSNIIKSSGYDFQDYLNVPVDYLKFELTGNLPKTKSKKDKLSIAEKALSKLPQNRTTEELSYIQTYKNELEPYQQQINEVEKANAADNEIQKDREQKDAALRKKESELHTRKERLNSSPYQISTPPGSLDFNNKNNVSQTSSPQNFTTPINIDVSKFEQAVAQLNNKVESISKNIVEVVFSGNVFSDKPSQEALESKVKSIVIDIYNQNQKLTGGKPVIETSRVG